MKLSQKLFSLTLGVFLCFLSACRQSGSPSSAAAQPDIYLTVTQNKAACPLTLTMAGPTTFTDIIGTTVLTNSLIAFNQPNGSYVFYFNGVTDNVTHSISGTESISCSPSSSTSCAGWNYTVTP